VEVGDENVVGGELVLLKLVRLRCSTACAI
jgi:hypothetical protein